MAFVIMLTALVSGVTGYIWGTVEEKRAWERRERLRERSEHMSQSAPHEE